MADQVPTGLPELAEILSGKRKLRRGELSVFLAPPPTYKTDLWRRQLKRALEDGRMIVCLDLEMTPKFGLEDVGVEPPDDPVTT